MSFRRAMVVALTVLSVRVASAQTCNLNPSGPDQLSLVATQSGSDFDIGWKRDYHDFTVPGGAHFEVCLNNCDTTTDPICDVQGYADQQNASGRSFLPPIPIAIGNVATCAVTTFKEPFATGTANVDTGALDVTAAFSADVYITKLGDSSPDHVCPKCLAGTCDSGLNQGSPCVVDETVTVQNASDNPYPVSRSCLPSGGAQSTQFTVHVGTGDPTISGLCPGQSSSNDCGGGSCNAVCTGAGHGAVRQACCSNDTTRSCFADPLQRSGTDVPGLPSWPDTTYPKTGGGVMVGVFCAPATPNPVVNLAVGLPGPGAFVLPVDAVWSLDPTPVTTSTTTVVTTTTTTTTQPPCTDATQCSDGNACTDDVCTSGVCSNPPATGAAGVSCQLSDVNPATVCGEDPVDSALQASITAQIAKAKGLLDQIAAAPAKKQKKLRNAAKAALKPIIKKAAKAAKKKTISTACRDSIKSLVQQLSATIAGL